MFGFLVITIKVKMSRSASGLSLNTFICYIFAFFFRLCSILFFEGYLPYDPTGDFIYRINEVISFVLCICSPSLYLDVVYLMHDSLRNSYNKDLDVIQFYYILIPAAIFALLFHPSLNQFFPADVLTLCLLSLLGLLLFTLNLLQCSHKFGFSLRRLEKLRTIPLIMWLARRFPGFLVSYSGLSLTMNLMTLKLNQWQL